MDDYYSYLCIASAVPRLDKTQLLFEFGPKTTCGENPKGKTQQPQPQQSQPAGQPELLFWLTGCLRAEARVIATRALAEKPNSFLLGQVMVMSNLASNKVGSSGSMRLDLAEQSDEPLVKPGPSSA
ncbi:hypothetical protein Y032_0358g3407 [Ancylostoma ceylanicum]|uniref:Uncharacterized protein n=1 Tax=Ancylostoma ceylanicum TaxID=53326 RepID=A0A016RW05_9BILA|nr:hypothetical protein Y032_0358g3407 [Ancylostoma ceylanicum]